MIRRNTAGGNREKDHHHSPATQGARGAHWVAGELWARGKRRRNGKRMADRIAHGSWRVTCVQIQTQTRRMQSLLDAKNGLDT